MTKKLFYEDAYVKNFSALVVSCEQTDKGFEVVLDRTAFFPEGGGQPGDTGTIDGLEVCDTQEKDGVIYHLCSSPVEVGKTVECELNFDRRFLFMQQHSGEHIFSGFIHQLTGLDNVGFRMGASCVTVDFNGPVSDETIAEAQRLANETVWRNIPVKVIYPSDEELCNYNYRSKKEIQGQVRLVEIEGADLCACCGTHVAQTGEIGIIKAVSSMNYKQGVRITLQFGSRALADYNEKNASVNKISALLKAKPEEVAQAVEKLLEKQQATAFALMGANRKLNAFIVDSAPCGEVFAAVTENAGQAESVALVDALCEKVTVAAVFTSCEGGCRYWIASRTRDVRSVGSQLNDAFSGRGGGKPAMVQGSLQTDTATAKAKFSEIV